MLKLKQSLLSIAIGLALAAGISYAWNGPTANPTGDNASAPINVRGDDPTTPTVDEGWQQFTGTKSLMMGDGTKTLGINGAIWTNGLVNTDGGVLTKGGLNKDNWQSVFPYWMDGKNYIRGTTIIADNDTNNRVGIGTANPMTRLDVRGAVNLQDSNNAAVIYFPNTGTYPNLYVRSDNDPNTYEPSSERLFVGGNGNVGVGTNAPQAKLHVAGSVRISDGTQGAGRVLTSDANGNASWQSGGGGSNRPVIVRNENSIHGQYTTDINANSSCPANYYLTGCTGHSAVSNQNYISNYLISCIPTETNCSCTARFIKSTNTYITMTTASYAICQPAR